MQHLPTYNVLARAPCACSCKPGNPPLGELQVGTIVRHGASDTFLIVGKMEQDGATQRNPKPGVLLVPSDSFGTVVNDSGYIRRPSISNRQYTPIDLITGLDHMANMFVQ